MCQDTVHKPTSRISEVNNHTQDISDSESQLLQCGVLGRVVFLPDQLESKLFKVDPKAPASVAPRSAVVWATFSYASQHKGMVLPRVPCYATPSKRTLTHKDK